VSAFQNGSELDGTFFVVVTAKPGVSLGVLEERVREEIARLVEKGVAEEEQARTLSQLEAEMVRGLERLGGFGGKADRLNEYLTFAGDSGFVAADLARYRAVTAARIADAARRRLLQAPPVVLSVVPHEWTDLAAEGRK
jgi:zinc protease